MQRVRGSITRMPAITEKDTPMTTSEDKCRTQTCWTSANDNHIEQSHASSILRLYEALHLTIILPLNRGTSTMLTDLLTGIHDILHRLSSTDACCLGSI